MNSEKTVMDIILKTPAGNVKVSGDSKLREITFLNDSGDKKNSQRKTELLRSVEKWFQQYISGNKPEFASFTGELLMEGTPFQKLVWEELSKIPYGQTTTYGKLADIVKKKLGKEKMSAQAIGNAVGKNPFPILIPCHRVLGKNNELTGYSGGLERKIALLKAEGHTFDQEKFLR